MIEFTDLLPVKRVVLQENSISKDELLQNMVSLFVDSPDVLCKEKVLSDILERELIMSTGIGAGVAIPHIHTNYINGVIVAFAVSKVSIDFDSMDKVPVNFIIMVLTSEEVRDEYLHTVAKFASLLRNHHIRELLVGSHSPKEVIDIMLEYEEND